MMDMEFEKVKDQEGMELEDVNTTAAREHVGEIERGITYLKERCRCSVSTFSIAGIKFLAKPIVIRLVYNITCTIKVLDAGNGKCTDATAAALVRVSNTALSFAYVFASGSSIYIY